ncbi:MAG TPA: alkaline phosphatase family protein [Jatrophihabitans sp.]|uniref:alkaline phosphatase family protein n=1 Tax=Jatrophihabitans sp. TaxID=1932789 RepID=UPI002E0AC2EB|nr:alkaline phosphatase family protein [Jatrophihabitans sp.]
MRRRIAIGRRLVMSWRPTGATLVGLLRSMATSFVALGVTLYVLPGRQSTGPFAVVVLVLVVFGVGLVLRPLLLGLTVLLGSFGLLLVGVFAQGVVLAVAISIAPDVHISTFSRVVGAAWLAAVIAAAVNWLLDAGSQDVFLGQVLGRVVRIAHRRRADPDCAQGEPGLVIVQLDGVGQALLRQAVVGGAVPTLSRWLRDGTHRGYGWHTGLPATTPAGQAVLLHGDCRAVPSFRWYEKESGQHLVANRPADAQLIQQRISTGRGLLADGGVSVSNLFSGDAPTRILTMSDARLPDRSDRGFASFAASSSGFLRATVVFAGQVVLERYQARRQRRRDVRPRVGRSRVFALLRALTTSLLHDLNVSIVAEQMAAGRPVVFVDFVDYDEIAHHAGPSRPESMRSLDGLDRVLRFLEEVAAETNRRYEIVVVSDHGQAQGEPFAHLDGRTVEEVVAALTVDPDPDDDATAGRAGDDEPERYGTANLLLTSAARSAGAGIGSLARRRARRAAPGTGREQLSVALGPKPPVARAAGAPVVSAAGSLAHIYLPGHAGRAGLDTIETDRPGLVTGLATHPGIGVVMVRSGDGLLAIGARGRRVLTADGAVGGEGDDPLIAYGPDAARDLYALDARDHVGDIVALGRFDAGTGEVAAFEELVGSHGGLGGDQTAAVLLVPSSWPALPAGPHHGGALSGEQVHAALLERLRTLGLRPGDTPIRAGEPAPVPT